MKLPTIAAALTVLITASYAAEEIIENFVLFGARDSTGTTPNYTQSIVVGNVPIHITNPLVIESINSTVLPQHYNSTFVGADGANTTLGGTAEVNPPQAQVSLFCSSQYVP